MTNARPLVRHLNCSDTASTPPIRMKLKRRKEKLIAQKPLVKQYKSEAEELLIAGDVVMAHCWSGDAFRATETRPTIRYVIPTEGSSQFIDAVLYSEVRPA